MPPWRPSPTSASRSRAASLSPSSGHRGAASPRCCTSAARWSARRRAASRSTGSRLDTLADDGADAGAARAARVRVPVLQPAADAEPGRKHRAAAAAGRRRRGRASRRARARGPRRWAWRIGSTIGRRSCPGGEMQRAAIARAVVHDPGLVDRRRAHREPRFGQRRAHPRRARAAQPRPRADAAAGHPRAPRSPPPADRVVHMRDGAHRSHRRAAARTGTR